MQHTNTGSDNTQGGSNKSGGLSWSMPPARTTTTVAQNSTPVQPPLPTATAQKQPFQKTPAVHMQSTNTTHNANSRTRWFMGAVAVLALVAIGWNIFGRDTASAPSTTTPSSGTELAAAGASAGAAETTPTQKTAAANNLTVRSPQKAGMSVEVTDATVSVPTWLVVYELYNGAPVRALGATMFFPENNGKAGVISLLRATAPNTAYFVGQSLDDGSHTYTIHVNKEVLDVTGAMAGVTFKTN